MNENREKIYRRIDAERDRQDAKWGKNENRRELNHFVLSTVLQEEAGEVAQALLKVYDGEENPIKGREDLIEELTQVAAVAVAWLENLCSEMDALDGHIACCNSCRDLLINPGMSTRLNESHILDHVRHEVSGAFECYDG